MALALLPLRRLLTIDGFLLEQKYGFHVPALPGRRPELLLRSNSPRDGSVYCAVITQKICSEIQILKMGNACHEKTDRYCDGCPAALADRIAVSSGRGSNED